VQKLGTHSLAGLTKLAIREGLTRAEEPSARGERDPSASLRGTEGDRVKRLDESTAQDVRTPLAQPIECVKPEIANLHHQAGNHAVTAIYANPDFATHRGSSPRGRGRSRRARVDLRFLPGW